MEISCTVLCTSTNIENCSLASACIWLATLLPISARLLPPICSANEAASIDVDMGFYIFWLRV